MTERRNLVAWTSAGINYPGFLSINREQDGSISIHLRSEGGKHGEALLTIHEDDFKKIAAEFDTYNHGKPSK